MSKYTASSSECLSENAEGDTLTMLFTEVSLMHVKAEMAPLKARYIWYTSAI